MDSYSLSGKAHKIWDTEQKSDRFRKREFVVEVNTSNERGTFIEFIKLQTVQDKCELLDGVHEGDLIVVKWALMGRRWKKDDKYSYFTNVEALDINVVSRGDGSSRNDAIEDELPLGESSEDDPFSTPAVSTPEDNEPDDLPF